MFKRRIKAYLITHISYRSKMRPLAKDRPINVFQLLQYLFLLFAAFYFTVGALAGDIYWLPSNPSSNLNTFKKQVMLHNANRLYNNVKASQATVRNVDELAQSVKTLETTTSPSLGVKTKFEVRPLKGYALYQVNYLEYTLLSKYDGKYEISLSYDNFKLRHTSDYLIMLDIGYSIF